MRSDETNKNNPNVISDMNNQTIVITFDIKNNAIIGNNTGITIQTLNI